MELHPDKIFLLMGPKGAGKTYLASRMEEELAIPFLRVEPIWLRLSAEMASNVPGFDEEGQRRVLSEVRALLETGSKIVLESTGTAPWFPNFLAQLKEMGTVIFGPGPAAVISIATKPIMISVNSNFILS